MRAYINIYLLYQQALAGCKQQDAHEYLQFLLNQLHTTNGGVTDNTKTGSCKCIIHRCFYGKLQSDVTCGNCHNVTTALDPVMDLSLELKPKPKGKRGHQTNGDDFGSATAPEVLTLQECLERFTTPEKLGIEYNCVKCSGSTLQEATKQLSVKRLPPVLCIQLKVYHNHPRPFYQVEYLTMQMNRGSNIHPRASQKSTQRSVSQLNWT